MKNAIVILVVALSLIAFSHPASAQTPDASPTPSPITEIARRVGAAAVAALADYREAHPPTEGYTITGTLTLIDLEDGWREGRECYGSGGYDDLRDGLDVTVRNGDGDIVGVGRLEPGEPFFLPNEVSTTGYCDFAFEVEVSAERFYVIEVGGRGDISYSLADLEEADWEVFLTVGSP